MNMKSLVTCVTLCKVPFERPECVDYTYLNYCSTFNTEIGQKTSNHEALKRVTTPYCFFCDHDDPMPTKIILPKDNMVYGDFLYEERGISKVRESKPWNFDEHMFFHGLIHKPVINVANALKVIEKLPFDNEVHFHHIFHFLLSYIYGSEYNPDLKMVWIKGDTGLHVNTNKMKVNTREWIKNNAPRIKRELLS